MTLYRMQGFQRRRSHFSRQFGQIQGLQQKRFIREFPDKRWNVNGLKYLLKKLRDIGTTVRRPEKMDDGEVRIQTTTSTL